MSGRGFQFFFQFFTFSIDIDAIKQLLDGFRTHGRMETVSELRPFVTVFSFRQQLFRFQDSVTRFDDNVGSEVNDFFQCARAHIQYKTHTARNPFEVPYMGYRSSQFDMAHSFTTDLSAGYFNATAIANDAFVTDTIVFTT